MIAEGLIAIGVDVGGTRTKMGLVTRSGAVLVERVFLTEKRGRAEFIEQWKLNSEAMLAECHVANGTVVGIGVGLPGFVAQNHVSQLWSDLRFLEGSGLDHDLMRALKVPARLENDARVVALGEAMAGAGKGAKRFLQLTLGTGLGFGFLIDGRFAEPTSVNHLAGHFVMRAEGPECFCGQRGCFEALVSENGLRSLARAEGCSEDAPPSLIVLADQNDAAAQRTIDAWLRLLVDGLNSYANLFAPDMICLGGGLAHVIDDARLANLQSGLIARPWADYHCELARSQLNERSGIIGAASLFFTPAI